MSNTTEETTSNVRHHRGRYVYEELRRQILTLQLKPGAPLDEISLAEHFGVSRSPVRDVLARLSSESLVTMLPNRTTIVTPLAIEEFPNYIAALDLIQRAVSRLAALHRTQTDIARIRAADARYLQALEDDNHQAMTECNKAVHMAIAHAAKNSYFIGYYERLLGEGQRLNHLHFDYTTQAPEASRLGRDHDKLIDLIVQQDADAAERAAHEHTMLFQKRFLDYMRQNTTQSIAIL